MRHLITSDATEVHRCIHGRHFADLALQQTLKTGRSTIYLTIPNDLKAKVTQEHASEKDVRNAGRNMHFFGHAYVISNRRFEPYR
jgi:hypothetical protein